MRFWSESILKLQRIDRKICDAPSRQLQGLTERWMKKFDARSLTDCGNNKVARGCVSALSADLGSCLAEAHPRPWQAWAKVRNKFR